VSTVVAVVVVIVELFAISLIRNRYMDTPFFSAALQVMLSRALVFAAGILIGSS
jgi:erythrin-vacuolar iron transport family protein